MQERIGVFVMNLNLTGCLCRRRPASPRTSPCRSRPPPIIRSLAFLPDPYAAALYATFLQLLVEKPASSDVAGADIPVSDGGIVRESSRAVDAASFAAADDDITRMARTSSIPLRLWRGRRLVAHLWLIRVCGARVVAPEGSATISCLLVQIFARHPLLRPFVNFSPVLPRAIQIYIYMITAVTSLFFSALTYAARTGLPNAFASPVPPLTIVEALVIALCTLSLQLPVGLLYTALFISVRCTRSYVHSAVLHNSACRAPLFCSYSGRQVRF